MELRHFLVAASSDALIGNAMELRHELDAWHVSELARAMPNLAARSVSCDIGASDTSGRKGLR